jgi:formate dehydrogenase subunit beta
VDSSNATLIEKARRLLTDGTATVIIGYERLADGRVAPAFVTRPEDCDRLVFDEQCYANLTNYLIKPEVRELGRAAIISKGCDNRAINVLIREARLKRDEIYIVGVECPGMDKAICAWCDQKSPVTYDDLIPAATPPPPPNPPTDPLESMNPEQRWEYWMAEFSRCIRCYACRQVCPICHCKRCLAEKNQPQFIDSSPHPRGNLVWNLTRAFHMVGRCVECGECERACPMEIPLHRLSHSMRALVREGFEFVPGMDTETPPPLGDYREDDKEDFFQ